MKKAPTDATAVKKNPIGENTVLKLTISPTVYEPKYASVLAKTSQVVTIPGFRKGKAPLKLVEEHVGASALLDKVLEDVLPPIYAQAVEDAKLLPLVPPQVKIISINRGEDWVVEAHTAIAPTVTLGDWKTIVKKAAKAHNKDVAKHADHDHAKDMSEKDTEQALLSALFAALIEDTNPSIPPLLLEHEARRQIEEFARTLASHRIELDQFLKSTGKTVEGLQQEYMASSLANLQVEFTIQAITNQLNPDVSDAAIDEILGKPLSTFAKESQARVKEQATQVAKRQATLKLLVKTAQES